MEDDVKLEEALSVGFDVLIVPDGCVRVWVPDMDMDAVSEGLPSLIDIVAVAVGDAVAVMVRVMSTNSHANPDSSVALSVTAPNSQVVTNAKYGPGLGSPGAQMLVRMLVRASGPKFHF